jgi:hypothetical protein
MKAISFFTFIIIFLSIGCKQTTEPTETDVFVSFEIESEFNNDSVELLLDDKIILDSSITTNNLLSLAWSGGLQKLSRKTHILRFSVVEFGVQKDYKIDTENDTSTVLLRFDKNTKQINIEQIKGLALRD